MQGSHHLDPWSPKKRSGLPVLHRLIPRGSLQGLKKDCKYIKLAWRIQAENIECMYCLKSTNSTFPIAKCALSVGDFFRTVDLTKLEFIFFLQAFDSSL